DETPSCAIRVLRCERDQCRPPCLVGFKRLVRSGVMQRNCCELHEKRMPWMALMWSQGRKVPHLVANQRCEKSRKAACTGLPAIDQSDTDQWLIKQVEK